jgi:hypothetical protein
MKIMPVSLSKDFNVQVVLQTESDVTRDFLFVTNVSPTPLYLTGRPMTDNATFEPISVDLPDGGLQ